MVSYEMGATINTGNSENVKIAIGMSLPSTPEGMTATYEKLKKDVQDKLSKDIAEIQAVQQEG